VFTGRPLGGIFKEGSMISKSFTKKKTSLKHITFIILFSINWSNPSYSQKKNEECILPQLTFTNHDLSLILDSVIRFEQKCEYYNDSLTFSLDVRYMNRNILQNNYHNDTVILITSIDDISITLGLDPVGFFKYDKHFVFVWGSLSDVLFRKSDYNRKFFFKKPEIIMNDDRFSMWLYQYNNGNLIFKHKGTFCE